MRNGIVDGLANPTGVVATRCLTVELLTGESIAIPYEGKTTCNTVWRGVEGELVARGVVHPQIFGLAIKSGSDWVFVDPDAKLSKYYPNICKEGKTHSGSGSVSDGKKPAFHCRVHFYLLDALPQNFDVVSLHHYYLQLRENLISAPRFPPASVVQPLAYALQFELGDWRPSQEFPRWASSHILFSSLATSISRAHQVLSSLGKEAAQLAFIRALMPQYNMHLFGMTLKTKEDKYAPAWVGVTPKGIEVYQNAVGCNEIPAQPRLTFLWANITKLYFERKKYGIRGQAFPWGNSTQKLTFTAATESVPQHLLHLCRSTHQFHLSNHKILNAPESVNGGTSNGKGSVGSSTGGESSSCNSTLLSSSSKNDDKMLDLSLWADGLLPSEHQRVSVISNASSNTTSGIVSSLGESEAEDLELPDCCTEKAHNNHHDHQNNSTSLESLSVRHPPPPRRPHHHNTNNRNLPSRTTTSQHAGGSSSSSANKSNSVNNSSGGHHHNNNNNKNNKCSGAAEGEGEEEEDGDAKHWYCDSDCEDCDDSGPCRSSMLVRTIGDKRSIKCAGHCECNSCVTDEEGDVDEMDVCDGHHHFHHNTPSMASEATLKAVELLDGVNNNHSGTDNKSKKSESVGTGKERKKKSVEDCGAEDKVQMEGGRSEDGVSGGDGEIEEYKLEDEHVYGEISEDPESPPFKSGGSDVKMKTEQQYSTIQEGSDSSGGGDKAVKAPKPKPRYNCIKSVDPQKVGCKCRVKDKCCNPSRKTAHCKKGDRSTCCGNKECKNKCLSASTSNIVSSSGGNGSAKENGGLTPKVASLKCLRKGNKLSSSNNHHVRRHISSRQHRGEINFGELPPVNYVEFGEKLQQGRYPSTRTVSDNFDTDSDYVQLPPLAWYPPPRPPPKKPNSLKLWKCVSSSKSGSSGKPKQASPPSLSPPVNISTLPRRNKSEHSCSGIGNGSRHNDGCRSSGSHLINSKVSSRSTNAINLVGKPEPPPKPRKSLADLSSIGKDDDEFHTNDGPVVDARFISTKPQILIQTAYATTVGFPVAIPSQAQVLVRGSKVQSHPTATAISTTTTALQHSQSVDNIYDMVAEEPLLTSTNNTATISTPPPYPAKSPLIIRPNNYIDVHASSVKSKLSLSSHKPGGVGGGVTTAAIANHYITNPGAFMGKNIGNRCGSVPNNLNNFLIGLQNLKPLSRAPIVHPGATSSLTLNKNNATNSLHTSSGGQCGNMTSISSVPMQIHQIQGPTSTTSGFTTVYTNQLTRSQINQFKAQLYSDIDYVIFPPKDPRVSQQEYFDSKYTTVSSTNSNPMLTSSAYQMNDIPPPYLPPPPPYPSTPAAVANLSNNVPPPLPKKNPKMMSTRPLPNPHSTNVTSALSNHSIPATMSSGGAPYHHTSFQSLYHPGSTNSHCSSSQYGYYTATAASGGLNSENLQRFLSTQSFTGSNGSSAPIYYPSSTQSAPPLPPYKPSGHVIIENGMRKAVQQMISNAGLTASDERLRMNMKLCRSEESLYSQPTNDTEEQLQAIYNLPPPPPYKIPSSLHHASAHRARQEAFSAAELDLAHLRARCHALELPLLRALCSEGELLNKNTSTKAIMQAAKNRMIRPTAHAHPTKLSLPPKNPLPIPPKPITTSSASHHTTTTTK